MNLNVGMSLQLINYGGDILPLTPG